MDVWKLSANKYWLEEVKLRWTNGKCLIAALNPLPSAVKPSPTQIIVCARCRFRLKLLLYFSEGGFSTPVSGEVLQYTFRK